MLLGTAIYRVAQLAPFRVKESRRRILHFFVAMIFTFAAYVEAHAEITAERPTVVVAANCQVKGDTVKLGDIARISARHKEHQELVRVLGDLSITESPAPKMKLELPGAKILAAITNADIDLENIGYSIPKVVSIERLGRAVGKEEVLMATKESLFKDSALDLQVREVIWDHAQIIPVGKTKFNIQRLGTPQAGKVPLRITVRVEEKPAARFLATAIADDWREVPVLTRSLDRGMLIAPSDIELVRLNLFQEPRDIAAKVDTVVGKRLKQRIGAGETIRKNQIDIPPLIPRGKRISMIYQVPGFQATATGVAMEDGHEEGIIKVKNDTSRKVVRARVISAEQVEVSEQ